MKPIHGSIRKYVSMAYNFENTQVQHPTHRTNLTLQNCHLFPNLKQIGHNKLKDRKV
jgi:hypothetical protein